MHRQISQNVVYYTFECLQAYCDVTHAVSTRHGGCSEPPYYSLNLSKSVGDDPRIVDMNLVAFHSALGLDPAKTVSARQARADRVAAVSQADAGKVINDVDALITDVAGLALLLRFADCVPILLFDPIRRAIGVVHAGWSGTVLQLVTHAVHAMSENFDTMPQDLIAGIGPSIGPCCYCIGPDVELQVRAAFPHDKNLLERRGNQIFFDLWAANRQQLERLGVSRIETASVCTAEHSDEFYSARAEKPNTGRFGAIIALPQPSL